MAAAATATALNMFFAIKSHFKNLNSILIHRWLHLISFIHALYFSSKNYFLDSQRWFQHVPFPNESFLFQFRLFNCSLGMFVHIKMFKMAMVPFFKYSFEITINDLFQIVSFVTDKSFLSIDFLKKFT